MHTVFAPNHHLAVINSTRIEGCHHIVNMNMNEWIHTIKRHGSKSKEEGRLEEGRGKEKCQKQY